jgi:hypothetical protein
VIAKIVAALTRKTRKLAKLAAYLVQHLETSNILTFLWHVTIRSHAKSNVDETLSSVEHTERGHVRSDHRPDQE